MGSLHRIAIVLAAAGLAACIAHDTRLYDGGDAPVVPTDAANSSDSGAHGDDSPSDALSDSVADSPSDAGIAADGAHCSSAIALVAGSTRTGEHTPLAGDPSTQCSVSDAPQRFYDFVLPAHMRAVITATPTGDPWRLVLRALVACDAPDCLRETRSDSAGAAASLTIDSPGDMPLTKFITVSGEQSTAGGAFDITLRLEPITTTATCSRPLDRALTLPTDSAAFSLDGMGTGPALTCASRGPGHVFPLHVSERTGVRIETAGSYNGCPVAIRRVCDDPSTELACSDLFRGMHGAVHTTLDAGDYFVVVASEGSATDCTLSLTSTVPTAPNASCFTPTPVVDGTTLHENVSLTGTLDLTCGRDPESDSIGNALYYSTTIPAGYTLLVDSRSYLDFGVISPPRCLVGTCVSSVDHHVEADYRNRTTTPQDVLVLLGMGMFAPENPQFEDLTFRMLPPASNASCASATVLADGAVVPNQRPLTGGAATVCGAMSANTLFYAVDVPPHYALDVRIELHRDYFFDHLNLEILDGCDGACVASAPSTDNDAHAIAANVTDVARRMIVVLADPGGGNAADLSIHLVPPPAHSQCSDPVPLVDGSLTNDYLIAGLQTTSVCSASAPEPMRFYSATIPPGQTLTAIATEGPGGATARPKLGVVATCDAMSCAGNSMPANGISPEVLSFANTGATPQSVVIVAHDPVESMGYFALGAQIASSSPSGRAADVLVNQQFACARRDDGTVWCPGSREGETWFYRPVPRIVAGLDGATQFSLRDHGCARRTDGTVACWGANSDGQLGDGTTTSRAGAAIVPSLTHVMQVAAGSRHTCALLADGTVQCWGCSAPGICSLTPSAVPSLSSVVEIAAGIGFTCARSSDGTVRCWGFNDFGQLGDGTIVDHVVPTVVAGVGGASRLAVGEYQGCAVLVDGTVRCWGSGYLGDGETYTYRATPRPVTALTNVLEVSVEAYHSCALVVGGAVWCWGDNRFGQLGTGSTDAERNFATLVTGLDNAVHVAAGWDSSCAVRSDHTVWCWGANFNGGLGDGTLTNHLTPAPTLF